MFEVDALIGSYLEERICSFGQPGGRTDECARPAIKLRTCCGEDERLDILIAVLNVHVDGAHIACNCSRPRVNDNQDVRTQETG